MPRHLISDAHEWINEVPTVPVYFLAKPQPRERAWHPLRGKKTLLSLTLVCDCEAAWSVQDRWEPCVREIPPAPMSLHLLALAAPVGLTVLARPCALHGSAAARTLADGEFGWGGTSAIPQRRCPKVGSMRTEISCRPKGEMPASPGPSELVPVAKARPIDPLRVCTKR